MNSHVMFLGSNIAPWRVFSLPKGLSIISLRNKLCFLSEKNTNKNQTRTASYTEEWSARELLEHVTGRQTWFSTLGWAIIPSSIPHYEEVDALNAETAKKATQTESCRADLGAPRPADVIDHSGNETWVESICRVNLKIINLTPIVAQRKAPLRHRLQRCEIFTVR